MRSHLLLALLVLEGCGPAATGPRLEASWTGSDTGAIRGAATVGWCPVAGRLEVTTVSGDLGFGLALFPVHELAAGAYFAFDPGIDSARRPGVSGAARWFTEEKIAGFQSDSGSVTLQQHGDRYDGRFALRLRSLEGQDTIRAAGTVRGLLPGPCLADSVPNTAPSE